MPTLFPKAIILGDGYRITSKTLGRNLEEDISITPHGIKDFGVHDIGDPRQGKRTPIDLVMEWGDNKDDLNNAVAWLRKQLGIAADDDDDEDRVDATGRPIVRIVADGLSKLATRAQEVLLAADVQFYERGGMLARPIIKEVSAFHDRTTKVAQLEPIDETYMRDKLSKIAIWERFDGKKKRWVSVNPPPETAPTILSRKGEWLFPSIAGVITTPTMRPDGSLLLSPGFDAATRLLLVAPPPMPSIPDNPTREDGLAAVALLEPIVGISIRRRSVKSGCVVGHDHAGGARCLLGDTGP